MERMNDGSLHSSGYGAPELKKYYQPYMSQSLVLSILLQVSCVAAYYAFRQPEVKGDLPRVANVIRLGPIPIPPPLSGLVGTSTTSATSKIFKDFENAIPVPSSDPIVDTSNTIPTQTVLTGVIDDAGAGRGWGDGSYTAVIGTFVDTEPPRIFQPVEKEPMLVKRVEPGYPETAFRAGIPGTVVLNLWVDQLGRVRKAEVAGSDNPLFDSVSVRAATQWVFTPAIMNHKPVSVWVTVPFRFKIQEHQP